MHEQVTTEAEALELMAEGWLPCGKLISPSGEEREVKPEIWEALHLGSIESLIDEYSDIAQNQGSNQEGLKEVEEKLNMLGYSIVSGLSGEIEGLTKYQ
jgi:hypothetical protein